MPPVAAGKSSFDFVNPDVLFSFLGADGNEVFLDMACGAGRYSLALAERLNGRGTIHAVDLWEDGISGLREQAAAAHLTSIRPLLADITRPLPLDADLADACLMATVLHDLAPGPRNNAVAEAARILKPGGALVVVEFKKIGSGPGPRLDIRLSEEEITALAHDHGFSPAQSFTDGDYVNILRFETR